MSWDQDTMIFGMTFDDIEVLRAVHEHRLWAFNAHNIDGVKGDKKTTVVKRQVVANFPVTDGVEDIDVWHARLGHTGPEYIRLMVDRSMAKGIMLKKRGKMDCADCHFGKQRRKTYKNSLERNIAKVNDMIFANLLIPGLHNGTQYSCDG
ncbi:Retrovirus-related pol Polyprotein [Phytophthora megakarya]|uniref:Retrovirus-related pol Polyprotein n=1 Tax=Phytophthora megakarya TaxID=4795 RepID=A0A225UKA0_9STRA|nr:Retrovirus-related pol Polyprotein [Phytophthora megakarya]